MPTGILQTVSSYLCNGAVFLLAKYLPSYPARGIIVIIGCIVGLISAVFLYTLPLDNLHGRLAALYCSYFYLGRFFQPNLRYLMLIVLLLGPYIVALGINTANTAGHTKKVTTNAIIFISYCVSNIIAPQFFKAHQAPLYPLGMGAILGSYVLSVITMGLYMA